MPNPSQSTLAEEQLFSLILRPKPIGDIAWRHRLAPKALAGVPCSAYSDLLGAIEHLASVTNFVPEGRLLL